MTINKYTTSLDWLIIENPVKSFFDYCIERENIRLKREKGEIFPWSDDKIFQKGRFLNVFREDDKVSKSIIQFANPAKDNLLVELSHPGEYELIMMNIDGKKIFDGDFKFCSILCCI